MAILAGLKKPKQNNPLFSLEQDRMGFFEQSERPTRQVFRGSFTNFQLPSMVRVGQEASTILDAGRDLLIKEVIGKTPEPQKKEELTEKQAKAENEATFQRASYQKQESESEALRRTLRANFAEEIQRLVVEPVSEDQLREGDSNQALDLTNLEGTGDANFIALKHKWQIIRAKEEAKKGNPALSPNIIAGPNPNTRIDMAQERANAMSGKAGQ